MQHFHRLEGVALQLLHQLVLERRAAACRAEGAVPRRTSGASGDLRELRGIELAKLIAVEFSVGGERDMVDVEIEAHADGIGRDQVVDVTRLIHRDLRVARARRQRSQHDRDAAALTADQFADGIDLLGGEGDDGGPAWQPRDLLFACERELREARTADDVCAREQLLDDRPHGRGAEYERLLTRPPVQHPVGEHMTTFKVGTELDLIDGQERDVEIARHRFHG